MARLTPISKLKLKHILFEPLRYGGLSTGLIELPLPEIIRIGRHSYNIPLTLDDMADNITYGQRLYLVREETVDVGFILRFITGYYYPMATGNAWDEQQALNFGGKVLHCLAREVYPVANHLLKLTDEMVKREQKLLYRAPTKQEKAAGIEKLNMFSDLSSIMYLQDSFKCPETEVMRKPYNDCLVRFMMQKEQAAYQERLSEVYHREAEAKSKTKHSKR